MTFLPSPLNTSRGSAWMLRRFTHHGHQASMHRKIHAWSSATNHLSHSGTSDNSHFSWNRMTSRDFSVKGRQRKEERMRQRQEKRENRQPNEKAIKVEEKAAAPIVTQTKASDGAAPGIIQAPAMEREDGGFVIAAAPPDEDEEEFTSRFSMPDREAEKKIGEMQTQVATLYKSGHYKQGLEIAQETLQATKDHFGFSHPATASSYLNVGLFHKQLGNFALALENYQQALKGYEETVGKEHDSYAMVLHNLGLLYQSRLHFDEQLDATDRLRMVEQALESLEAAYKIRSVELPPEHPYIIATQTALGMTLTSHVLSQHKRVSEDMKKTVPGAAGYRSVLPSRATEQAWATAEGHLRDALHKAVQNPRGESSFKRGDKNHYLNIQKKHNLKKKLKNDNAMVDVEFPTQTASAATASQNLAVFLKARSTTVDQNHPQYSLWVKEAQDLYQKALEVRTALLPKGHPDIYATQHSLAELYDYTGQEDAAEEIREMILETYYDKPAITKSEKKKQQKSQNV